MVVPKKKLEIESGATKICNVKKKEYAYIYKSKKQLTLN
jgi:hypothetical protein